MNCQYFDEQNFVSLKHTRLKQLDVMSDKITIRVVSAQQ